MSDRREFPLRCQAAIIKRATVDGRVTCERCGAWCKLRIDFQIDHVLAEGMRPAVDKRRPLVPAEGQLLCLNCHAQKTKGDKAHIALAVRQEAKALGARKRKPKVRKVRDPLKKIATGRPRIAREYGL